MLSVQFVAKHIFNGSVDMTSKIHAAIPPNTKILVDLGAGDLKVGFITGSYSKSVDYESLGKTEFGEHSRETIERKRIQWGKASPHALPFLETKTLQEIYDVEGEFTITSMEIQAPYERKVVTPEGVPTTIECIAYFMFKSWPFKPKMILKILNRMPSSVLYDKIKKKLKEWNLSKETKKRQKDTWLINRMPDGTPAYVYKLWLDAAYSMILPEASSTFLGRELGTDYTEVF